MTINVRGQLMTFDRPKVMGILNVTPDSFFDGGRYNQHDAMMKRIDQMLADGADIIDVGGYSTRPGAPEVSADDEWHRLEPALEILSVDYPDVVVSVDTFRADVARKSVEQGKVAIINDISAGALDADLLPTVADLKVPYVLMHMQGTPKDMQQNPHYDDVVGEVIKSLSEKMLELHRMGIADVIIDPGFGFGKTMEHNYTLMRHLRDFEIFDAPLLVGISRKSMIYKLLGNTPQESLNGTTVLNTLAVASGAHILRVHDVREARECVDICKYYMDVE